MNLFFLIPFAAGALSLCLSVVSLLPSKRSPAAWFFAAGMAALGLDSVFTGLSLRATQLGDVVGWLWPAFLAKSFVPALWLCFSLTYSRSNYREFLWRWKVALAVVVLLPIGVSAAFLGHLASPTAPTDLWWLQSGAQAKGLDVILLGALVLILINLEQTLRSAVGTLRWRVKFVVLALAVIFAARLYVRIQAILFSTPDIALWNIESGGLLIGCLFLMVAYARTRFIEIDVYPSLAVLRSSLTVLIVGAYLLVVGVLAQVVTRFGGAEIFQFQAVVVLVGMAGLAVLLLSDRSRQTIHAFVVRHFSKAQHDSVRIWTLFSRRLARVKDEPGLCALSTQLISENFDVLSVSAWLLDEERRRLVMTASTAGQARGLGDNGQHSASSAVTEGLAERSSPFNLEDVKEDWATEFRHLNATAFTEGGNRWCVPLRAGEQTVGVLVLADRVRGAVYTVEELELLKCIGDHITSVLINLRLASEVARGRELEAFRTMSAFFVHDLKNAASSLNLMLKNLPIHFGDPAFREDALRGIGNTAGRIDEMIARFSALRQQPSISRVETDLNQIVNEALDRINGVPSVQLTRELHQVPKIFADREQLHSVVTNLVLNARDAVGPDGRIEVCTAHRDGRVVLSVADNGCGMSQKFVKESLFRPFQTTKKKGIGIGLFQSQAIVRAHGALMQVESEPGKGTTFSVSFPVKSEN